MGRARQTLERRQLGLTLRRLRTAAGKSQHDAAQVIGKVRSRIIDLEDGRSAGPQDDLVKLLDFYEVENGDRDTVLALGVEARKRQKRRAYMDLLPDSFQRFSDLEASAVEVRCCESSVLPGLLQAPGYVRALIGECDGVWWDATKSEREQRVSFRLERQARTLEATETKSFQFVLSEDALRAVVGSREVMREQLQYLRRLIDERDDFIVQVLPHNAHENPGRGGGLTLLSFGENGSAVGFSTTLFGPSTFYHEEADTAIMLRGFTRLQELALSSADSRRLIDTIGESG